MSNATDWGRERERLALVEAKLAAKIAELDPQVDGLQEQAADIRKRFWEEVTVNTSTSEDYEETFFSIRQQEAVLAERERSQRLLLRQRNNLRRLQASPYFGRVDFREAGESVEEPVYIGVSSFADEEAMSFLVYDWRTPVASLYYDHVPGPASYDTPGGTVGGTMTLKRQYRIQDGELRSVFDASVTIGDELLQQVLGHGADNRMKSIVATIQREQNAVIRDDRSRMLIVQGAAGSGKTSAALQRAAYLLYKYRDRLKADQIVLFSPNPLFNGYVSTVLPELGEENMQQTTFQDYLDYWLGKSFRLEDPFDQIEYALTQTETPDYGARMAGMAYKASEAYRLALDAYAARLGEEGLRFAGIRFMGRELISAEDMAARFYGFDRSIRLPNRVALLQEWLLRELAALERKERKAQWAQEEAQYLDRGQYAESYDELLQEYRRDEGIFMFAEQYVEADDAIHNRRERVEDVFDLADREEALLRKTIVKERFKPLRRSVKRLKFLDFAGMYGRLFESGTSYAELTNETDAPAEWADICRQTAEKLNRRELFYEDATPYLYLKELIEGVRTNTQVRHVFVDEGQDYSVFQYAYLRKLFPHARMTVLGDFGQAIFAQATELGGADSPLLRLYGEADTNVIRLARSYRSTREIADFTRAMLAGGEEIVPFDRPGPKPLLVRTESGDARAKRIAADLAALTAEGFGSVAVVTKTAAEAEAAHRALAACGRADARLIDKASPSYEKGIMVIPAYLAKGVEFDAVLIHDAGEEAYAQESERKLFYTACTRAMHRLTLYAAGAWSPFVRALDPALYETAAEPIGPRE
ncbi:DNA helicase-2 / ATP-dependent DNA helicase PcrA [Paenibacillus sp. UNC496MF]|uniref:RNA polymerase recycling motor HelD n=1 Tax=Paenibacillus sp. UNC496MF TaxID=1502753 RepID=UPI0008EECA66|nr:RNA polymerase recycling motor HelD [Paenibacillus sp. UNC496MF]SFI36909.1 DNA helicase-2 / ATP-dependent DNA helicase PcrA [Paenibacillus sp. UNC496MF]